MADTTTDKKAHWASTPAGRARMSKLAKRSWRKRRAAIKTTPISMPTRRYRTNGIVTGMRDLTKALALIRKAQPTFALIPFANTVVTDAVTGLSVLIDPNYQTRLVDQTPTK